MREARAELGQSQGKLDRVGHNTILGDQDQEIGEKTKTRVLQQLSTRESTSLRSVGIKSIGLDCFRCYMRPILNSPTILNVKS